MVNDRTPEQSSLQRFIEKRWVRVFLVLIILCAAVLVALPHVIRHKLERWLIDNGAQSAEITEVRLNLFTGTVGLDALQVRLNDNVVLGDSTFDIDIQLLSLFKKEVHLKTGKLLGLIVDIDLLPDGTLRIGSITIPSSSPETEKVVDEKDISWFFRASHVELEDCLIRISMPKIQEEIFIEQAVLTNLFTGESDQPGSLKLNGTVNETPLHIELDKVRLHPDILAEGRIKVDSYKLVDLEQLLGKVLDPFAGNVSLDGKAHFAMAGKREIAASYDGKFIVDKIDIGNNNFSTQAPSVSYSGKIQFQQNSDDTILIDVNGMLLGEEIEVGVPSVTLKLTEKHLQLDGKTRVTVKNGVAVASDATFNLNSFNLDLPPMTVKHSGLKWQGHFEYKLMSDSGIQTVLADGELALQEPLYRSESQGFSMNTEAKQVSWQGQVDYLLGADKSNLQLGGTLFGNEVNLLMPELLQLSEDSLSIAGKTTLNIKPELQAVYDGDIKFGQTKVTVSDIEATGKEVAWKGEVGYQLAPKAVSLNGKLLAKELESHFAGKNILINQQDLSTTYDKISLQIGEQLHFKGNASLQGDMLQVAHAGAPLLSLDKTSINSVADTSEGGVYIENITLSNLNVPATDGQPVAISVPEIVLNSLSTSDFTSAVAKSLEIKQPVVRDTKKQIMLANVESITGNNINIDKQRNISLASLSSGKGWFLKKGGDKEEPHVTLGKLLVSDISWTGSSGFFCDQVELDSLFANYTRIKSIDDVAKQPEPKPEPEPETVVEEKKEVDSASVPLQINTITVTGKSGFKYVDQSTSIPFLSTLNLETFKVQDINSATPEKPFTYLVKGMFGKYSPFDASGSVAPFSKTFFKESKLRLRNYPLPKVSPYAIDAIGTLFTEGQLDVISEVKVKGNRLDLDNKFILKQVKTDTVHKDLLDEFNSKLPVSLDTALSMLADKNGNIELSVPVSGPRSELHVNITDLLITAFSKAITVGLTPYLAYTVLGPTGALAYLGLKVGQSFISTDLPILEFENGASELTDAHKKMLERVGKAIARDKNKDYSICSRALVWELAGDVERNFANQQKILDDLSVRKDLFVIAEKRAKIVQEHLVQNYSINKERLLICAPILNFEPDGKSFVLFMK